MRQVSGLYIALCDLNFDWKPNQLVLVEEMWKRGESIEEIARLVRRPVREVLVLIFDRLELGYIKPRKGSIFGDIKQSRSKAKST